MIWRSLVAIYLLKEKRKKKKQKKKETNKQKSWNGSYAEEQGRQGVDMTQPAWLHQEQVLPDQSIGHP